jgi:hypothetical protein
VIRTDRSEVPIRRSIEVRIPVRRDSIPPDVVLEGGRHWAPSMFRMSIVVPVRNASDHAVAAARRPAVPVSVGEPGANGELDPAPQAVQSTARKPTTVHRPIPFIDSSSHSRPVATAMTTGASPIAGTGCVIQG